MIRFLPNSLKGFDQMVGVELKIVADGYLIQAVLLEQKKGNVNLVKQQTELKVLSELKSFVGDELPISLSISGKGILHKKIEKTTELDTSKLFSQAIPNAKASDFYLQICGTTLSVIRKSVIDELVKEFKELGLPVISVSLGGLAIQSILPLIELEGASTLHVNEHQFQIRGGEINKYDYGLASTLGESEKLRIGELDVALGIVPAYASAFQQFLLEQVQISNLAIESEKEEFVHKKVFTKLGWGVLGLFMIVLLANFAAFSFLSSSTDKLLVASSLHQSQLELLDKLQKEVGEKDRFFQNEGWMHASKASFYADRIAATVPTSVLLKTLAVNPINEKETRDLRKQMFDDGLIVIAGSCKRPIDLNGWIKRLKDFAWAKKVNVETYQFDSGEKAGNFRIEVQF